MALLMGIDLGTSSLKTIIMDEGGNVLASASQAYQFSSPHNNFAEQDPEDWWNACVITIRKVLQQCGNGPEEIRGISFSGQMHGLVMLDASERVIRPAILHCDARSGRQVAWMKEKLGEEHVKEWVMNPIYTGFLLPSLLWVRENEPENYARTAHVFLPKDYLKFRLTGEISSDYSDASATLAFDIKQVCWSKKILEAVDVPESLFPKCYGTAEAAGTVCLAAAEETGLKAGTIVVAGGGDQVMQGIGNGITRVGEASANIGTSGQVSFQSAAPLLNPSLCTNTFLGYKKDRWITMGAIMNAGLCYKWFNSLFEHTDYEEMNRQIAEIRPGSGGLLFLPYLNGERTPHLDPDLSGVFMGLNLNTNRACMARAVMEGVSFALMQCMEVCGEMGLKAESIVASGGGARSMPWLQMQADIYGVPVRVADTEEQAGLGAAIAAGVGAGIYPDIETGCAAAVRYKDLRVMPDSSRHEEYMNYYQLFKDSFQAQHQVLNELTRLGR